MPEYHPELTPGAYDRIARDVRHAASQGYEGTCYYDREGYLVGTREAAAYSVDLHHGGRHTAIRHLPGGHVATVRGLAWPRWPRPQYYRTTTERTR
nr:MAG TPA: hypothetical protein [Caudoviricetes sp.]DAW15781.1 MAG TPA: hypothetical protein [Caudoviricetes sp.]